MNRKQFTHCHHGREIACLECVAEAEREAGDATPPATPEPPSDVYDLARFWWDESGMMACVHGERPKPGDYVLFEDVLNLSQPPAASPVRVEGNVMLRTLGDFERACEVHLAEEQRRPSPDSALIGLLCDGVRFAREFSQPPAASGDVERLKADIETLASDARRVAAGTSSPDMERLWTGKAIAYDVVLDAIRRRGLAGDHSTPGGTK